MTEENEKLINETIQQAEAVRDPLEGLEEKIKTDAGVVFEPDVIECLAALKRENMAEFMRVRAKLKLSRNVTLGEFDKAIARLNGADDTAAQGQGILLPQAEPWPEAVDGAELLASITEAIRSYVVMPMEALVVVALWVIHTYLFEVFTVTPRLTITSPEKGCGKTTLLDVLYRLVLRPLQSANVTAAVIFRVVEAAHPTLLIDEGDTFLKDKEDLRGVMNSGHRKGGYVCRVVGDDHEVQKFSTWSPMIVALIGKLHDTLQDRSIVVTLRRRLPHEKVKEFREGRTDDLNELASKIARWAADNREAVAACDPEVPEKLFNRVADNWRPLLAIADIVGGDWPSRVRVAATALTEPDTDSERVQLLADIRDIFDEAKINRLFSADIVTALCDLEDRPWAEWKNGKGLSANTLARLLAPFRIIPGSIRGASQKTGKQKVLKGYDRDQFEDAWERYIPGGPAGAGGTASHGQKGLDFGAESQGSPGSACDSSPTSLNARERANCDTVTGETARGSKKLEDDPPLEGW